MTRLLAFLNGLPLTVYLVVGLIVGGSGWLALDRAHQRKVGRIEAEQQVKQAASDSAVKALSRRNAALDALVATATATAAKYQAGKHASDVQAGKLKTARDSLAQAVADSLATIEQLRARGARMIAASDSAEKAHAEERVRADVALASARRAMTFAVDSVRAAGATALDAMRQRAEATERVQKVARAGLFSRCGVVGGYGGVLAGGKVLAGPAVTVGCKVFPW
ncbi:MAG: hypothetical protein Q8K82_13575 [Gemmatimonadaceae bacterium]|nr:hypothetical protein [Gemmatimonadaceae bacterium]